MDKSELYIKMCTISAEIQDQIPSEGTAVPMFTPKDRIVSTTRGNFHYYDDSPLEERRHYWIPRLDQLQEFIINREYEDPLGDMMHEFLYWIEHHSDGGFGYSEDGYTFYFDKSQFKSMEQLWLAFVMYEKHKKVWDGMDWVKE